MQNQVEALYLDEDKQIIEKMMQEKKGDPERGTEFLSTFDSQAEAGADQGLTRAVTRDGVGFYTSDKWAEFYLTSEVAVVTNIGHPPVPPGGYIPLRHGHGRELPNAATCMTCDDNVPSGFSVDTLLWNEELLEQRILQLTAWTRRSPVPRRQKLERMNRMLNPCNSTDTKSC